MSAVAVADALGDSGHAVTLVGIDRRGKWHLVAPDRRPLVADGSAAWIEVPGGTLRTADVELSFDVAFPVLHGPHGEDGTVQGLFEAAGLPYVGSNVLASAVGMDKDVAKRLAAHAGIAQAAWLVLRPEDLIDIEGSVDEITESLQLPVFVKPAALGSSVGVAMATTNAQVKKAIEVASGYGPKVIVEEAIVGREIEVAVLDGPRASLPGEIVVEGSWYDYEAKYVDSSSRFVVPTDLTASETARVRKLACEVFELYECRGLARVDFLFEEDGRGFLLNEINTMPGFTPISGFPKMWQATGMTYSELCDTLVRSAVG